MIESTIRYRTGTILLNVVVTVIGTIILLPIVWMVSASFKPLSEIYAFPPTLIPQNFTTGNYERLFSDWLFGNWYVNSLAVAILLTLLVLFFTSLTGFAFAKYRFRGRWYTKNSSLRYWRTPVCLT